MLHDGHGYAHDIGFLKRVGADDRPWNLTRHHDDRHGIHVGGRDARNGVSRTGSARYHGNADTARGTRVPVGFVHRALFVSCQHVANLLGIEERVVHLYSLAAWITEHELDALGFERCDDGLRPG